MGFRTWLSALACALSFLCVSTQAAPTVEISRGLDWLQGQVAADGSLAGEANSVATSAQIRTEVARTLREQGRVVPIGLFQGFTPDSESSTEIASRVALAYPPGGGEASSWVAALVASQLSNGSMPALKGYEPTDQDIAWALRAMRGQPTAVSLAQALIARQQADGSWTADPFSPLHSSGLALCGLSPLASSNPQAALAASKAAAYLTGKKLADGSWSTVVWVTAQVYECMHSFVPNQEDHSRLRDWLLSRQAADGSWGQDPFVTSLALRALALTAQPPLNPVQSGLRLRIVDGQTGASLSGIALTLGGAANLSGSTDGAGSFQQLAVSPGSYQLTASYAGYTNLSVAIALKAGDVADLGVLRMSRTKATEATTATVSGVVTDASNGAPLSGALVAIPSVSKSALTDAQGRFSIDSLAPGAYGISAAKSGYSSAATSFSAVAGGSYTFSPRLPLVATGGDDALGCRIHGKLLKASGGAAVSGASIALLGANVKTTTSDASGAYVLAGLVSGSTTIRVTASGHDTVQVTAVLACATPSATEFSPRLYATATSPADANTASLTFIVADSATNAPLVGVSVSVSATGHATRSFTSGVGGRVTVDNLPLASVQVRLSSSGYDSIILGATINEAQRSDIGTVLMKKSKSAVASGVVTDASTGAPMEGVSVALTGATSATSVTDSAGRFMLAGLAAGSHTVTFTKTGFASVSSTFVAELGGEYVIAPKLKSAVGPDPAACTLAGTILTALGGSPIVGAQIALAGTNNQTVVTDAAGAYSVSPLVSGNTRVTVSAAGFDGAMFDFAFACGRPNSAEFSPKLYPEGQAPANANTASITFTLLDAAKETPLAGVNVQATPLGQSATTVTTQPDGKFTVAGLKQSSVRVVVDVAGYQGVDLSYQVTPLQAVDLGQLRLRPASSDPLLPDLQVLAVKRTNAVTDPQSLRVSGSLQVTVANKGLAATDRAVELLAFEDVNRNGRYDAGADSVLGRGQLRSGVAAGGSEAVSISVSGSLLFRDAPIHVWADSQEELVEKAEGNNVRSTAEAAEVLPAVGTFKPTLKWHWTGTGSPFPEYNQVMMAPVVGRLVDTNSDGVIDQKDDPCLAFTAFNQNGHWHSRGVLRVVNGRTGQELLTINDNSNPISAVGSLALADLDSDGKPEIIAVTEDYRVAVYRNDGTRRWVSAPVAASAGAAPWGGAAIADLDGDGSPEILFGRSVLNSQGALKWQASGTYVGSTISGSAQMAIPVVADLNGIGQQNVILGGSVYDAFGQLLWQARDGFAAVADFHGNGQPSIAVVGAGKLSLFSRTGQLAWTVSLPTGGHGGPPTIADVDGDGVPEIGVAAASAYTVFRRDGSILWSKSAQDASSQMTGSTVFDFDGDGSLEVLYTDEIRIRAFKGANGDVLWDVPNSTGTTIEYPLVVDIDADGHADLVTVANDYYSPPNATALVKGVRVFQDLNNSWVNTRQVWNQHAYSITNINDDLTVPSRPTAPWAAHNTYRANKRIDGLATAVADLTSSLLRVVDNGRQGRAVLKVRVGNGGALTAPAGVKVAFYGVAGASSTLLGVVPTTNALGAGGFVDLSIEVANDLAQYSKLNVVVDDDGTGKQVVTDFDRSNNALSADIAPLATQVSLSLTTDASTYKANQSALFKATVTNGGSFTKAVRVRYLVQTADGQPVSALSIGSVVNVASGAAGLDQVTWSTGSIYVGSYRLSADLLDSVTHQVLASATSNFAIQAGESGDPLVSATLQLDKSSYGAGESVRLTGRVTNLASNQTLQGLTLKTTVLNPDGSNRWSSTASLGELSASTLHEQSYSVSLGGASAGLYEVRFVVSGTDGAEIVRATKSFSVTSVVDTGAGLTGLIEASPQPVAQGDTVSFSFLIRNQGNAALTGLPLTVRIVDPQAGTKLAELSASVGALGQGGSFAGNVNWVADAPVDKALVAVLSADVGGRSVVLAQDNLTVKASEVRLSVTARVHAETRLLVLVTCVPGDPGTLAGCLAAKQAAVQAALTALAVPHKVVTTTVEFQTELRCGNFNAYWVNAGGVEFSGALLKELRAAIRRGEGLLLDGGHDARVSQLHTLAGALYTNRFASADQPITFNADSQLGSGVLSTHGQSSRFELLAGAVEARFDGGEPAVVSGTWGQGASVLLAFDLADTLLNPGPDASGPQRLRDLLAHITQRLASTPLSATVGDVLAVGAQIRNQGSRTASVEVRAGLPAGLRYVDSSLAPAEIRPANSRTLGLVIWRLPLAGGAGRDLLVRVAPEGTSQPLSLPVTVYSLAESGEATQHASAATTLATQAGSGLGPIALERTRSLTPTVQASISARDRAVSAIQQAQAAQQQGDNATALQRWLTAADELEPITSAAPAALTAAQSAVAWAIEAVSDNHCYQAACLKGSISFYSTTPVPLRDTLQWGRTVRNSCPAQIKDAAVSAKLRLRRTGAELLRMDDNLTISGQGSNERRSGWQITTPVQSGDDIDVELDAIWQGLSLPLARSSLRVAPPRTQ